MTCADSALLVCMQVRGRDADITLIQCNYTNKTPRNLLPTKTFNYLVFRNVQNFIHTNFYVYGMCFSTSLYSQKLLMLLYI